MQFHCPLLSGNDRFIVLCSQLLADHAHVTRNNKLTVGSMICEYISC
jgi:hypothetical protein